MIGSGFFKNPVTKFRKFFAIVRIRPSGCILVYDGMFCYCRDGGNDLEPGISGIILHLDEGVLISTISINCSNNTFCPVSFKHRKSIQSKLWCNTTKGWHCNH